MDTIVYLNYNNTYQTIDGRKYMKTKITKEIDESIAFVKNLGLNITQGGAWCEYQDTKLVAVDPLIAVLIKNDKFDKEYNPRNTGFIKLISEVLDVDHFWIYRFHMGYDRQYQILVGTDDGKGCIASEGKRYVYTKDDVSEYGIALGKKLK